MAKGVSEYTPLSTQHKEEHILYTRRWYILFVFSLLSASQCTLWISYNAVSETTQDLYKATTAQVNFLAATGPIAFIPFSSLTSWIITEYGLRVTCIMGALLCAAGGILRCFATEHTFWMVIIAQLLNAASGPVVMNAPPAISATWFGVNERTFATAVGTVANALGSAAGFFIGLLIHNTHQLVLSLYYEAAFSVALLILIIVYFPSLPPSPPTNTSTNGKREKREAKDSLMELWTESVQVFKSRDGVLILLIIGISAGFQSGWNAMLINILKKHYKQSNIQWLGVFNILGSLTGGMLIGKLHDKYRHFKPIIAILFLMSGIIFAAFSFLTATSSFYVPFASIIILVTAAGFTLGATSPISYEALVEVTYPVKEEISAGLLSLVNNIACLAILFIGDGFSEYINWTLTGVCIGCFLFMLLVRERYLRTSIDLK